MPAESTELETSTSDAGLQRALESLRSILIPGEQLEACALQLRLFALVRRRMIVHRDPRGGRYHSVAAYGSEETVAPLAAPESCLRIRDAFPG